MPKHYRKPRIGAAACRMRLAAAFALALGAGAHAAPLKTISDSQLHTSGSYAAHVAPFNKGSYVSGDDYLEGIKLDLSAFPNQDFMGWRWPDTPCPKGVYSFLSLEYGNYDNTKVKVPIPPKPVRGIRALSETHDADFSGDLAGFDVIDDLFLTTEPGDHNTHAYEVEVFLHSPEASSSFVQRSKPVGKFTGSGVNWTVAVSPGIAPDILFMPENQADMPKATIDLKAMLDYLVSHGVIPGSVYFNGLAYGAEVTEGSGAVKVRGFSVTYH